MITTMLNKRFVIYGMGVTGLACARYFSMNNKKVVVIDSRENPPLKNEFIAVASNIALHCASLENFDFSDDDVVLVSPGIALDDEVVLRAQACGARISSDVEIFMQVSNKPIIAVTGSNGKSTVVSLLEHMLNACGMKAIACGNIGLAVMDVLLQIEQYDIVVLELSSFQLERLPACKADAVCVLNISEDHMDRYASFADYIAAKQMIFSAAKFAAIDSDEALSDYADFTGVKSYYGFTKQDNAIYCEEVAGEYFVYAGDTQLFAVNDLHIKGRHNWINVMAALSLCSAFNIDLQRASAAALTFPGLPHRCQWVRELAAVNYFNDSKATNVGACIAAVEGLAGSDKNIILLAGGVDKNSDFTPLVAIAQRSVKALLLFGIDANKIAAALSGSKPQLCSDLEDAVTQAQALAQPGDIVLLAPACASFDMFDNYIARGNAFVKCVQALEANDVIID